MQTYRLYVVDIANFCSHIIQTESRKMQTGLNAWIYSTRFRTHMKSSVILPNKNIIMRRSSLRNSEKRQCGEIFPLRKGQCHIHFDLRRQDDNPKITGFMKSASQAALILRTSIDTGRMIDADRRSEGTMSTKVERLLAKKIEGRRTTEQKESKTNLM